MLRLLLAFTVVSGLLRAQASFPPAQDRVANLLAAQLRAPLHDDLSPGARYTLEGWFYLRNHERGGWLMGKELAATPAAARDPFISFGLHLSPEDGTRLQFASSNGQPGSYRVVSAPDALPLRRWFHVAVAVESGVVRLLLDGAVVATGVSAGAPPAPPDLAFCIGRPFLGDGTPTYSPFPGLACQVRFWNIARTPAQIAAARFESLPADRTGLVAAWPLDDAPDARSVRDLGGRNLALASPAFVTAHPVLGLLPLFYSRTTAPLTPAVTSFHDALPFDFDRDGDPDLIVTAIHAPPTIPETRTRLRAFRNDRGTFVDATDYVLGHLTMVHPYDHVIADFDGDGRSDLLIAGTGSDTPPFPAEQTRLLLGTADGRLRDETAARLPQRLTFTHGITAADIDADGDLDIYMGRSLGPGLRPHFYLNDGRGYFTDAADRLPPAFLNSSAGDLDSVLVDVNGDRHPDLVLAGVSGQHELLLNDGRGRFAADPRFTLPQKFGGDGWISTEVASADFDGDGRNDLVFAVHGGTSLFDGRVLVGYGIPGIQIALNHADGRFRDASAVANLVWAPDELYPERLRIVDFNRDGLPDLLLRITKRSGYSGRLLLNRGPGYATQFIDVSEYFPLAAISAVTAADVDLDGLNDLVFAATDAITIARSVQPLATSRLANLSVRTQAGTGDATLIAGFALAATGPAASPTKPLLVRAIGPTLSVFGVDGPLADPVLTLAPLGSATLATNDNWSGTPALKTAFASVGAFALAPDTSRDAALVVSPPPGAYTATISGGTGIALVEVYDLPHTRDPITQTPSSAASPRLTNVSARTAVGTGAEALIAGFVIDGTLPKRLLLRAVGPTLAAFGVGGTLADPVLEIRPLGSDTVVARNDNWAGTAALKAAFASVGAFAFATDDARDAALALELPPGAYTATVSGKDNTTGVALVEVYELP